jgi:hypothetical protein
MEKFGVELVFGGGWDKDNFIKVGVWGVRVGFLGSGRSSEIDGSKFKKEEVVR